MLTLVINLEDAHDRFLAASGALDREGIQFRRVAAVDGRGRSTTDFPQYSELGSIKFYGRAMTSGEIGCFLSHVKCAKEFLSTAEDYCLVLEDDLTMPSGCRGIISMLVDRLSQEADASWDVVNLGKAGHKFTTSIGELQGYRIQRAHYFPVTTTALLWNRSGAQAFVDASETVFAPVDHFLRRLCSVRGTGIALSPALIEPSGVPSMIDAELSESQGDKTAKARKRIPRTPLYFWREFQRQSVNYFGAIRGIVRERLAR